jgi:hypothetical protein
MSRPRLIGLFALVMSGAHRAISFEQTGRPASSD